MTDFPRRLFRHLICSELVPVRVRVRLLRYAGIHAGRGFEMYGGARLGSDRIRFGDGVFVNAGLFYDGGAPVAVGDRVAFGPLVRLITTTHAIGGPDRRCVPEPIDRGIRIGDGCWIAAGVTILPGVTIAPGCVIGAGAVLTSSTEPDGLYLGVPARRVQDLPGFSPAESRGSSSPARP